MPSALDSTEKLVNSTNERSAHYGRVQNIGSHNLLKNAIKIRYKYKSKSFERVLQEKTHTHLNQETKI